ncbi:MAG: glycosyl transferase family protein [Bacteroidota bacterium]
MADEHPFAPFIRALGKGKQGARALTEAEAEQAMQMILSGDAQPMQVGAFLMLMRLKEETPEELAGFVRAVQQQLPLPPACPTVRLDWSAYAGKRRQLPWFVLSALLLAQNGIPVFMHGTAGFAADRVFVPAALAALGVPESGSLADAARRIASHHFAFVRLENFSPALEAMLQLRPILGLRTPVHSVARMLNPLRASASLLGIFHPGYRAIHQGAAQRLGLARATVLKGEGGEAERNPDAPCLVQSAVDGVARDEEWPALFATRHLKDESMDVHRLAAVWRGEMEDEYGAAAAQGTAAIALWTLGEAATPAAADALAREMWAARHPALAMAD